jgi:hypothetical protein
MKYIIPKGKEFYCEFTIKEPGASVPMDVTGMTGGFTLSKIGVNPCVVLTTPISIVDPLNGLISITLTSNETAALNGRKGFPEDGYALIPTYSGSLDLMKDYPINVLIPKIYVLDDGTSCLAANP